ncbi:hypothetical protein ABG067_004768 [Albugo candida]|uniref:Uncharacterized protein n=1 Tax=Albugo candida TaxID=65357 RepID=A0A024GH09_9STRA|nr:unnamed protein product [Albugo candida]|eukprot:CCI45632.1 unnamed protein product [Albugo candida]
MWLSSSRLQAITVDISDLTFLIKAEPLESFLLFGLNFSSRPIHSLSIAHPVTNVNALETTINHARLLLLPTADFDKLHTRHAEARNSTLRNCLDISFTLQVGVKSSADEDEFKLISRNLAF